MNRVAHSQTTQSSQTPGKPLRAFYVTELLLLVLALVLFFWRLGAVPLFDLDEGLYAACARQMVLHGDWITPRLNSHPPLDPSASTTPFFEKPILVYWAGAGAMRLFGLSPFAARLPSALASLLTVFLVWWFAREGFGQRAAAFAALTYLLAPLTLVDARQLTTDALLTLWFTLMMVGCCRCFQLTSPAHNRARLGWALLTWAAFALSVLTKGAAGALPFFVVALYLLFNRIALHIKTRKGFSLHFLLQLRPLRTLGNFSKRLFPLPGVLLFLLIAAPWHYLIWRAGGRDELGHTWFQEYILRQHLGRFRGLDKVHDMPLPSYIVFFLIGFFPWACFSLAAFRVQNVPFAQKPLFRYLLFWFWVVFGLFSLASAKLPSYIAPLYPAAAILTGRWLDVGLENQTLSFLKSLQRGALTALCIAILLLVAALVGPYFVPRNAPVAPAIARVALHATSLLVVGMLAALLLFGYRQLKQGLAALVVTMVLVVVLGCTEGYHAAAVSVLNPYQLLAKEANTDAARGIPIVYYHIIPRRPSMLFYANYSPYEHKEVPLFPWLTKTIPPSIPQVEVITSAHTWLHALSAEVASRHLTAKVLRWRGKALGGWVLLRIELKNGGQSGLEPNR